MNIHNTRKQSPNLSENRSKTIRTTENSILTKPKNNYDNRSNKYHFSETKNKITQQLSELFIPEKDLSRYLSMISKFSIDNSNFLQVWGSFVESVTNYLGEPITPRCSTYINEQIDQCRNQVNELYNRLNSDHKQTNKKISTIYKNIQTDLDNLYSQLNQPGNGKIKIISESSNLFDRFTNALQSNYISFFQCASSDQKTMNIFLKSTLKPICNIINCSNSVLQLEDMQKKFSTQLDRATATFSRLYNSQYPSPKKRKRNSQIPVLSNTLKPDYSNRTSNSTSKIPKSTKRSSSLSSPLSQKPLGRYNSIRIEDKNNGSNIRPNLHHRISETSIISLPDFSQKKFLPRPNKNTKNDNSIKSKKNSRSDNEEDQKNSLDTHMHDDDLYHISNGKLSDSGDETTNVPIKPKPFKISQSRYDHLNKKYTNNSPTKTSNNIILNNDKNLHRKSQKNQLNLNMNLNTNLNSINSLSSQMRSKRDEEARMVKTIDNITRKNDRLKEQHKILKQKIEKDRNLTQINNLKNEIETLKHNLNDSQFNSDEMKINVEFMRDLIGILNSNIQYLDEECEQALRIKNGIEAEDETANFDNPNLKRSCETLKLELSRLQSQINEDNNKREMLFNSLSNSHSFTTDYDDNDISRKSDTFSDTEKDIKQKSNMNNSLVNKNLSKQKKIQSKPKFHTQKVKPKQTKIPTLQKNITNTNTNTNSSSGNNIDLNESDFSISNEEFRDAFFRLKMSSQVLKCANKHLMSLFDQMTVLPNPIEKKSVTSFFKASNRTEFNELRKLSKSIEKLEANVKKVRQTSSFSSLYNMYFSMKSNAVRMNEEIIEINMKNKRLLSEISRLSLIQSKFSLRSNQSETDTDMETGNGNLKRKSFDLYEQLKEKSRELLIKYFAIQKTFSEELETAEKYKIELQLDDIQEQYTTVMMEIDRIGDTKIQEKLHTKRKIKIKGRKEIPKLLEILEDSSKFNLEAEKKAVSLEKKVDATFSSLLKTVSQKKNKHKIQYKSDHLNSQKANDVVNGGDDDGGDDVEYIERHKFDNDEENVTRLAEVIIECRKVSEILAVIKERTNQFLNNIHKNNQTQFKDDEVLKKLIDEVKNLLKKGGSAAQTKLRIVNLKKEIQSYSNLD